MARILLINFDKASGTRLSEFLRSKRHDVSVCSGDRMLSRTIQHYSAELDLIIFDISDDDEHTRDLLVGIHRYRSEHGPRPMLLCISRVYRGPRFELDLERKGARLVYEH